MPPQEQWQAESYTKPERERQGSLIVLIDLPTQLLAFHLWHEHTEINRSAVPERTNGRYRDRTSDNLLVRQVLYR